MEGIKLSPNDFIKKSDGLYINNKFVKSPGMLLIWANWCSHCTAFKSTFNQIVRLLGNEFQCVSIEHSDLQNNTNLIEALNFRGYPTIKFFDQNGKIIGEYKGDRSKPELLKYICKIYHHCVRLH